MQTRAFGHAQVLPRCHSSFARRPLWHSQRCNQAIGVRCASGDVMLEVKGLEARVAATGEHILRGVNLTVKEGEVHAIMGTNGSGKSTFSKVLVGHPDYEVTGGTAMYKGKNLLELEPEERACSGLFMSFQSPVEVPGVSNAEFLRISANARRMAQGMPELDPLEFYGFITPKLQSLNMDASFLDRNVNEGFSGGEKKRNEILQMSVLDAELSILDEIDSGLDIDALKDVASAVNGLTKPETATIMVTHYKRLLNYIKPDQVHVMESGKIIFSGDISIADILEAEGYEGIKKAIKQQGSNGAVQQRQPAMSGNPD
ncbi:TPA: ABC transporter I member 6, chloroplastic [Trebouxia sp. C0004]